jgi:hypothetical protein
VLLDTCVCDHQNELSRKGKEKKRKETSKIASARRLEMSSSTDELKAILALPGNNVRARHTLGEQPGS